ncbi:MAG: rhomboid family intramembrane serine protease [Chloroflexi bacterium]|nr:rhomboid family intramembrane serine protease [Chloroflexota bacterium]
MGSGLRLPMLAKQPNVTWAIIAVNVLMWLLMTAVGSSENTGTLLQFGAMFGPYIAAKGEYWRLFTAMFLHAGLLHLGLNMFGLWIFGRMVEGLFGHVRFAVIYVIAGLAGSVVSYLLNQETVAVGASGAVFGVLGATAAFFISQRQLLGRLAQRNITTLAMLVGINLLFGFFWPGIDNWAHLGGLAGGLAIGYVLSPRYELKRDVMGMPMALVEQRKPLRHLKWVVPVSVVVVALGVVLGNMVQSDSALSEAIRAERAFDDGDLETALAHAERAIELSPETGGAYYVRALIREDWGDRVGAVDDAVRAVRLGDSETSSKAQELLIRLRLEG